jgi:predicted lipoprotein
VALRPNLLIRTAAPAPADKREVVLPVIDSFVIPAYRALASASDAQERAWNTFAAARNAANFAALRNAYGSAADAWAVAQTVRTGPITLFLRTERFAYWPEARNATQRALGQLLSSRNPADLSPQALASGSVAGQGLTALERLLYDAGAVAALTAAGAEAEWRARVGQGIARNLNAIARDVLNEWTAPDGMRASIAANRGWRDLFADSNEAATLLLTDLVTAFRVMHDVKLLPVLGGSVDEARPRLSESWRSGRGRRNLALNLVGARDLTRAFGQSAPEQRRGDFETRFAQALRAVSAIDGPLGDAAADPMRRPAVEAARDAIRGVQLRIAETLPADLGITLGFNALDGD